MAIKRTVLTVLLLSATPAVAAASPRTPPPDKSVPRVLLDLRSELFQAGRDKAVARMSKFRPLCDKDGYPLVGNVAVKGELYQPSQFCAAVRKAGK